MKDIVSVLADRLFNLNAPIRLHALLDASAIIAARVGARYMTDNELLEAAREYGRRNPRDIYSSSEAEIFEQRSHKPKERPIRKPPKRKAVDYIELFKPKRDEII